MNLKAEAKKDEPICFFLDDEEITSKEYYRIWKDEMENPTGRNLLLTAK